MVVFSSLRKPFSRIIPLLTKKSPGLQIRNGSSNKFVIAPSSWDYQKFKDLLHFYIMLGILPIAALTTYVNLFIGPAELVPIPEGYEPEPHEYYCHPIKRWFAKHIYPIAQQTYEKNLHVLFIKNDRKEMTNIENKMKEVMYQRGDTKAWYYQGPDLKYIKKMREEEDNSDETEGSH